MPLWQAIILGAVQGLTEFLPISSTAHLALVPWLFGWRDPGLTFDVALHVGTLVAVVIYFWKTWMELLAGGLRRFRLGSAKSADSANVDFVDSADKTVKVCTLGTADSLENLSTSSGTQNLPNKTNFSSAQSASTGPLEDGSLLWLLVLGTIPAAVVGLLFEKQVETTLRSPLVMGVALIVVALLMAYADRKQSGNKGLRQIGVADALLVGCSQAVALIPGVSRSGITITTGLFLHFQRDAAARFSFLLSTPIIAGACLKKLLDVYHQGLAPNALVPFAVGALVSAVTGYATIAFFLKFLQFGTFRIFVYYRIILGIIVLALAMFYRLNLTP